MPKNSGNMPDKAFRTGGHFSSGGISNELWAVINNEVLCSGVVETSREGLLTWTEERRD